MNYRRLSQVIVLATVAVLVAYDVLPYRSEVHHDTLSEVVRDWAAELPAVPFLGGVLCGHFFLRPKRRWLPLWASLSGIAVGGGLLVLAGPPGWVSLLIGIAAGALLWPLDDPPKPPPASGGNGDPTLKLKLKPRALTDSHERPSMIRD